MVVWHFLGWVFAVLFGLLLVSMLLLHNWLSAFVLFALVMLCLPPVTAFLQSRFGLTIHPLLRAGLVSALLIAFVYLFVSPDVASIYKSPDTQARLQEIYDEKMEGWPVPYEDVFLDTDYGVVHVIVSGPESAPPLVLLHASGVASWSWKYNIQEFSEHFRVYAIDTIGDAGKSEYATLERVLKTGEDQGNLYAQIADLLGIEKADVVGASEGGFIGTNFALYHPERVRKLVLLGPMGYAGALKSGLRIMAAQMFPLRPIQDNTFDWAFSSSEPLQEDFEEWFRLLMSGTAPQKVMPMPFSAEQRQSLQVPVLFVLGERDHLVGDPQKAAIMVQDVPDVKVEIVNAGHLMGGEIPNEINSLVLDFLEVQ